MAWRYLNPRDKAQWIAFDSNGDRLCILPKLGLILGRAIQA
jgi:hypothetical protein